VNHIYIELEDQEGMEGNIFFYYKNRKGVAINFVTSEDIGILKDIEQY
jgi:hypothetical protein